MSIIRYDVNIFEIAAQLVVVESVSHDEFVADFEGAVADRQRLAVGIRLEEERADFDAGGIAAHEVGVHVGDAASRVDDVLDDDDVASCDVVVESQQALHVPRRTGPFVGGELDERNLAGEVDLLDQIAQEHERTVEHPDEDRTLLVAVIGVETLGDGCDGAVDQNGMKRGL